MDHYSRFIAAVPYKAATAEEAAKGLFHGWISNFDIPECLLSDRGSHFLADLMKELLKLFGINKLNTTAYHPQTNGKLERAHRTLVPMLMSLCKRADFKDWDIHLQKAVYILRIHDSEGTGTVPMELIYGRMPRHPVDILYGSPKKVLEYVDKFKFNLPLELLQVREKTMKIQLELERERLTRGFREKHPVTFIPGQQVMLHKLNIPVSEDGMTVVSLPTKFYLRWTGPHEVVRILSNNVVEIRVDEKNQRVNVARLLHYEPFTPSRAPKILSRAAELHLEEDAQSAARQCELQQDRKLISELLAIDEMEEVILTKEELTALTGVSSSITKEEKQRIRRERDREARNLSKHIQLLREKLSISEEQPEPWLSLTQLRKRVEDLKNT